MTQTSMYVIVRTHDDSYRLDRTTPPGAGATAFVIRVRDRLGNPLGWRLKPSVVMQGSKGRIWPTAAEALASTKLVSLRVAKDFTTQCTDTTTTAQSKNGTVGLTPQAAGCFPTTHKRCS